MNRFEISIKQDISSLHSQPLFMTATVGFEHSDVTIEDLFNAFRSLLIACTFHDDQYKNHICELAEDFKED